MRAILTMLICVFVTGCASVPADLPRAVIIPRDCESLAARVDEPAWRKGTNAKAVLADTTVALIEANGRLGATGNCQARQREAFAKPGGKDGR